MTTTTHTLEMLLANKARDFALREYAESEELGALRRELEGHLYRFDKDAKGGELGFEGLSSMYEYGRQMNGPYIDAHTKLGDLRYRWIAVFPVTGTNEGHYVHVEIIMDHGSNRLILPCFLTKTFAGQDAAIQIAAELCRCLGV